MSNTNEKITVLVVEKSHMRRRSPLILLHCSTRWADTFRQFIRTMTL